MPAEFRSLCDESLLYNSRLTRLRTFPVESFLLREDAHGGTKVRKLASLLPFLRRNGIQKVALIAGAQSSVPPLIIPLLRAEGIGFRLFVRQARGDHRVGNAFLTHLLVGPDEFQSISPADWPRVEEVARKWGDAQPDSVYLVPEGLSCPPALSGACTLAEEIFRHEAARNEQFAQIWIDAGTGFAAAALCGALAAYEAPREVHVLLTAGDEASWRSMLAGVKTELKRLNFWPPSAEYPSVHLHAPATARAFGSVNAGVRRAVRDFARTEGVLTDPVYTAKLLLTARESLVKRSANGPVCIVHGGGTRALLGFAAQF